MEELSVEQKAKAYDEAAIIRNEIIAFLKEGKPYHCPNSVKRQEWAAWVEKHTDKPNNIYDKELSEILGCVIRRYINDPNISYTEREKVSKEIIPYVESLEKQGEHSNFLNKIQIGDKVTRNKDGVLVNLSQLNRVAKPTNEEEKDILEDAILDGNEDGLIAETVRYKKEKQGEQNSNWSEEDKKTFGYLEDIVNFCYRNQYVVNVQTCEKVRQLVFRLKSLCFQSRWSKDDIIRINEIIETLNIVQANRVRTQRMHYNKATIDKNIEWLKSLYQDLKRL